MGGASPCFPRVRPESPEQAGASRGWPGARRPARRRPDRTCGPIRAAWRRHRGV